MSLPGQIPLFGAQMVHVGRWNRTAGAVTCVLCGVSLAFAAVFDDCSSCRGRVEPVPPWMVLGAAETPAGPGEARAA